MLHLDQRAGIEFLHELAGNHDIGGNPLSVLENTPANVESARNVPPPAIRAMLVGCRE